MERIQRKLAYDSCEGNTNETQGRCCGHHADTEVAWPLLQFTYSFLLWNRCMAVHLNISKGSQSRRLRLQRRQIMMTSSYGEIIIQFSRPYHCKDFYRTSIEKPVTKITCIYKSLCAKIKTAYTASVFKDLVGLRSWSKTRPTWDSNPESSANARSRKLTP